MTDKATPTPSPASVDSVMAKAMKFGRSCHTDGEAQEMVRSDENRDDLAALRAEVERLAAQAAPTDKHAERDADGIDVLRGIMANCVAAWDDRKKPKADRHYQDGALDIYMNAAQVWLKSIEGEWVAERVAKRVAKLRAAQSPAMAKD